MPDGSYQEAALKVEFAARHTIRSDDATRSTGSQDPVQLAYAAFAKERDVLQHLQGTVVKLISVLIDPCVPPLSTA